MSSCVHDRDVSVRDKRREQGERIMQSKSKRKGEVDMGEVDTTSQRQ